MSANVNSDVNEPQVHQQHDTSYKFLLSSKKLFVELLRSCINKSWVNGVDENQVEEIPHSFVLPDFRRKEADVNDWSIICRRAAKAFILDRQYIAIEASRTWAEHSGASEK